MNEKGNTDIEEWAKQLDEDFQKFCEEETRRIKENGLISCVIYDDELWDYGFNWFRASFELRKEDLKEYVYVDNNSLNFSCKSGYEDYYLNRTYKFIRMETDGCAIFYRNY